MNGRDSNGRFTTGNQLSTGRLPRKTEDQYIDTLSAALTVPKWKKVIKKTIEDAQKGDARARELLFKYVLGTQPLVQLNQQVNEPDVILQVDWEGAQTILRDRDNQDENT